jgi:predicted ATPase
MWPTRLRYEIRFQLFNKTELQVQNEYLFTFPDRHPPARATDEGGAPRLQGEVGFQKQWRFILRREYGEDTAYTTETKTRPKTTRSRVAAQQLALPRVQFENQLEFPAARWLFDLLVEDAVFFNPDWNQLRMASPPGLPLQLMGSGRNAPWIALELQRNDPERFEMWKQHVHIALPQVSDVSVHEREDDHHAYFRVRYNNRYDVPSSGLSDGTLRILVLTLLAYLERPPRFLVTEEIENGIHPKAIEAVLQSLASIYDSQVIVSSHSPVVLAHTDLSNLLAARLRSDGAAEIIRGSDHPRLVDWKGEVSLSTLFAAGILG